MNIEWAIAKLDECCSFDDRVTFVTEAFELVVNELDRLQSIIANLTGERDALREALREALIPLKLVAKDMCQTKVMGLLCEEVDCGDDNRCPACERLYLVQSSIFRIRELLADQSGDANEKVDNENEI